MQTGTPPASSPPKSSSLPAEIHLASTSNPTPSPPNAPEGKAAASSSPTSSSPSSPTISSKGEHSHGPSGHSHGKKSKKKRLRSVSTVTSPRPPPPHVLKRVWNALPGRKSGKPMTLADTLLLSPWQKWRKYNRIPWKAALHLLLLCVVITQVILHYVEEAKYARATINTFNLLFVPDTGPDNPTSKFYTMVDVVNSLKVTVDTYYNINNLSMDKYEYLKSEFTETNTTNRIFSPHPISMDVTFFTNPFFRNVTEYPGWVLESDMDTTTLTYQVNQTSLGPFDATGGDLQKLFQRVTDINLRFDLINIDVGVLGVVPVLWHLEMQYTKVGGQMSLNLAKSRDVYFASRSDFTELRSQQLLTSFNCITAGVAFICLVLALKSLYSNVRIYMLTKTQYEAIPEVTKREEDYLDWGDIRFHVKVEFFNMWTPWMIITCVCLLIASLLGLLDEFGYSTSTSYNIFQGLGAFGATVNILRYLEYYQHFFTLILTIKLAFPRIARFIISAFPIYFGYVLLGVTLFSPYSGYFRDLTATAVTLFALLNGDNIRTTFEELVLSYPYSPIPPIYLCTFIVFFLTIVLNIFIFIIEDSYHAAKMSRRARGDTSTKKKKKKDAQPQTEQSHRHEDDEALTQAEKFDIFRIFEILDREYNDEVEESTSDDERPVSQESTSLEMNTLDPLGLELPIPLSPSSDSLSVIGESVASGGESALNESAPPAPLDRIQRETVSFDMRITYKKLKTDVCGIIDELLDDYEEQLDEEIEELKARYRERMKREALLSLKRSFLQLRPRQLQGPSSANVNKFRHRYLHALGLATPAQRLYGSNITQSPQRGEQEPLLSGRRRSSTTVSRPGSSSGLPLDPHSFGDI